MTGNSFLDDFKHAWNRPNNSPAQLIIINVVIFIILGTLMVISRISGTESLFNAVYNQFSIPPTLQEFIFRPWTIITYAFAHSLRGIFHILFNMLIFYWFSKLILEFLGNNKVISLYILGALAGGVSYLIVYNTIPFYQDTVGSVSGMVGASAAVYAVVVGAATFMPNYTFFLLFIGPVRIKYIALFYIVISVLGSVGGNAGGNIAHLGGAAIGYIYITQLRKGNDLGAWVINTMSFFKSFFVKQPKIKVTHRSTGYKSTRKSSSKSASHSTSSTTNVPQDEIDAILDKISQSGYESLSKEEKQKLFNASKK